MGNINAQALLSELNRLNVRLVLAGDKLQIKAPAGVLTPELRRELQENKTELVELLRKREIEIAKRRLEEQGWVAIHSDALGEPVVWLRDETVEVPEEWRGVVAYTLAELEALTKEPLPDSEDLKLLHEAKKAFRGVFVEAV